VPNIGWCDVRVTRRSVIFEGVGANAAFYFVHSYHLICSNAADSVATIAFGAADVTIAIESANIFGAQFHPEKSQDVGLAVLDNYARLASTAVMP
jgi:glutamine amidotransferase